MSDPNPVDLGARLSRILVRVGRIESGGRPVAPATDVVSARAGPIPAVLQTRFAQIAELMEQHDAATAEGLARDARRAFPGVAEAVRLHGIALLELGRAPEAQAALRDALHLAPGDYLARCNYATALLACGDAGAAIGVLQQVAREYPEDAAVHNKLADALRATGDNARAREEYLAALAAAPDQPDARINLATVEMSLGMLHDAERRLRTLLARQQHPQGFLLLGDVLQRRRDFAGAQAAYLQGAQLAPAASPFLYHAGVMADAQHHYDEAVRFYRRALQLDPDLHHAEGRMLFALRRLYDWADAAPPAAALRLRVVRGDGDVDPFAFLAEDAGPAEQFACARARAEKVANEMRPLRERLRFEFPPRPEGAPLKVGFISAGFGATGRAPREAATLAVAMFEQLGRLEGMELHLIATRPDQGNPIRERLRRAAHRFHEVDALSVSDIAQHIHQARIDILVDVDGWREAAMPELFALRPAPVQVNWLAHPGTTGAPFVDYLIADRFVVPEPSRRFYSEAVAWLPRCFQPADTSRLLFDSPPRVSFGLPDDAVVFACFNSPWKLNAASFARMCAVLRKVPRSVLWLSEAGRDANARLRVAAKTHGIDPRRLVFSPSLPHLQHLARHRLVDLFLDTNPCNASATASDAIWAGCPVLTRPGDTFASRIAGSLNHYLDMPELIAHDDAGFIAIAARLGNDRQALATLRRQLVARRDTSGLFDMELYAQDFAALLREIANRQREGLPPKPIASPEPVRGGWSKLDR